MEKLSEKLRAEAEGALKCGAHSKELGLNSADLGDWYEGGSSAFMHASGLAKANEEEWEKRVADLEQRISWSTAMMHQCQAQSTVQQKRIVKLESELEKTQTGCGQIIKHLQAQLAWTPVSDGLPTEPGLYVFLNGGCNGTLFEMTLGDGWRNHEYGEPVEPSILADASYWDAFRRITLPEPTP